MGPLIINVYRLRRRQSLFPAGAVLSNYRRHNKELPATPPAVGNNTSIINPASIFDVSFTRRKNEKRKKKNHDRQLLLVFTVPLAFLATKGRNNFFIGIPAKKKRRNFYSLH